MLSPLLAVAAILAGITIVSLGQGVFATLVPIRLTEAGLPADRVGLVVAASAVGFLAGCLVVGRLIRLVGHIRAFSAFAAASCLAGLALPWTVGLPGWFLLRLAMGFCSAGLFMVAESWLNELTPRHLRGRILTSYVVVVMLALGAGQALLTVVDTRDVLPFVLASAAFTLALIPVTLTRSRHPSVPHRIRPILRKAYRNSPVGAVGCVVVGLVAATLQGVAPVWGVHRGFSTAEIATLMAATQIGGLLCQWPLGWLSDRIDRRWVILGASLCTIVAAAGSIAAGSGSFTLLIVLFALWGGMAEAIYPLSVAHANDHAKPQDYVPLAGTLLILWSVGSSAGRWRRRWRWSGSGRTRCSSMSRCWSVPSPGSCCGAWPGAAASPPGRRSISSASPPVPAPPRPSWTRASAPRTRPSASRDTTIARTCRNRSRAGDSIPAGTALGSRPRFPKGSPCASPPGTSTPSACARSWCCA
jgi:MFS family permease